MNVSSIASLYSSSKGASSSTRASWKAGSSIFGVHRVSLGILSIGSEARLYKTTQPGEVDMDAYILIWRSGKVKASLMVVGLSGTVRVGEVVSLAVRQQARIAATSAR